MCVHATVAIGGVLRLPSSNQSHHVRCLRFRRPTGARAISVPSGRANDQDHPVAAFEGGADFIVPLPRSARGGVGDVGVRCGSGSLRRSAQPAGRRCRRSGAGRFQKTPSGVIQGFYVCGTNRGTTFLNYCFYWNNGGVVGSHPDRLVRPDSRWKSGAGAAAIARGWRRPGAEPRSHDTRVWWTCGREMHPRGHGCAMPLDRRAVGADRTRCAKRPIAGVVDIRYGRRRPRETSGTFAGHEGTEKASCIEAETVVAREVVAVAREASPAVRSTDTVTATPSAPNKRPAAHVESDTPRSPQATAGQLHRGASRSNAGLNRLRRKTADRPAKLIRTPARCR